MKVVSDCKIQLFADDTIIYVSGDRAEEIIQKINNDLHNIFQWLNNNCLQLNVSKTKSMIIRNKHINLNLQADVKINSEIVERVNTFVYLVCVIDEHLSFTEHYKYILNKIAKKVNVLGRSSKMLSSWTKLNIYKTIIAPHFHFCSTLLFLMNNSEIDALQRKQNRAMRIILGCDYFTRRTDMLHATNLLSVRQILTYNTMIFIYKMLNNLLPPHLLSNCRFVKDVHEHNTRSKNNFYIDKVNTSFSQNSLYYKGLKQYNELPDYIKNCDNLQSFKACCKVFVKEIIEI